MAKKASKQYKNTPSTRLYRRQLLIKTNLTKAEGEYKGDRKKLEGKELNIEYQS
jgi:hypothetical protein